MTAYQETFPNAENRGTQPKALFLALSSLQQAYQTIS
jgi:hypothetical protein